MLTIVSMIIIKIEQATLKLSRRTHTPIRDISSP